MTTSPNLQTRDATASAELQTPAIAVPAWKRYFYRLLASEVSQFTRYYDHTVQTGRISGDTGFLLQEVDCARKEHREISQIDPTAEANRRTAVLLNGTLNYLLNIQDFLSRLRERLAPTSRVIVIAYNPYLRWPYRWATRLGLHAGDEPTTFLTRADVANLARLTGFEIVRIRQTVYVPWRLLGFGSVLNYLMPTVPLLRWFALAAVIVLRPVPGEATGKPSLSIVIPARNERENIRSAIQRLPAFPGEVEVIFVEGHSTDGTWEQIQSVLGEYGSRMRIRAYQQSGRGKNDAVRLGFSHAESDLLTILDADLTVPPELLAQFYEAWRRGLADFVNGSRLVYPMEGQAMQFANQLGNVFFSKAVGSVLDTRLGDCLCGTKLFARHDYERFVRWRQDFGDFDPFGDFELLFPAAALGLRILDLPVRYRARTYGATNIRRFRDGWNLLRMVIAGFFRIRTGRLPR